MSYLVSENSLTASADAIREKTGSNDSIIWTSNNGFADAIGEISIGIDTSGDTVTPETLVEGTTAHNSSGEPITGTNPYVLETTNTTVNEQADLISQIKTALEGKAGGSSNNIPTCTIELTSDGVVKYYTIGYSCVKDNITTYNYWENYDEDPKISATLENVICGSLVYIQFMGGISPYPEMNNGIKRVPVGSGAAENFFIAPTEEGIIGTIYCYDSD